jgi:hypothetical protein
MPERAKAMLRSVAYLIIVALSIIMAANAVMVIGVERRTTTVSLPIEIGRCWLYSVPVLVASILSAVTSFYLVLAEARVAIWGNPTEPIKVLHTN